MISRIHRRLRQQIYHLKKYQRIRRKSEGLRVRYFNFWNTDFTDNWFYHFLEKRGFLDRYPDLNFSFFSVYGPRYLIGMDRSDVKIFFNAENVLRKAKGYRRYSDLAIDKVDLALGFRDLQHSKYSRFPLWILHMFETGASEREIRSRCEEISFH